MSALPYLKFAGPLITDAMADAVRDTMMSGWLTSGPRVAAFEAALSNYHGGRPARTFTSAHAYIASNGLLLAPGLIESCDPPEPTIICHALPPAALVGCEA